MDTPAVKGQITATSPNLVLLDSARPDIANLVVAMVQARDDRLSWRGLPDGQPTRPSRRAELQQARL